MQESGRSGAEWLPKNSVKTSRKLKAKNLQGSKGGFAMIRYLIVVGLTLPLVHRTPLSGAANQLLPDKYAIWTGKMRLGVAGGEVVWNNRDPKTWEIELTKKGDMVRLLSRDKWRGWYLTYDPTGKKKTVFLSKKPTAGSYWSLRNIGGPRTGSITANAGKVKDWYLDKGEAVKRKDQEGKPYTAHRVVLTKDPKPLLKFHIDTIAP
jgi:hypothetical protein